MPNPFDVLPCFVIFKTLYFDIGPSKVHVTSRAHLGIGPSTVRATSGANLARPLFYGFPSPLLLLLLVPLFKTPEGVVLGFQQNWTTPRPLAPWGTIYSFKHSITKWKAYKSTFKFQ